MPSVSLPITSIRSWPSVMQNKRASRRPGCAQWHDHVNHVNAPAAFRHWLTDRGSLTAKLIAQCDRFSVQRICQQTEKCWSDEFDAIGLPGPRQVHAREVLLRCDGRAAVYAHTVMPLHATATQWPLFRSLGNRSLGSTLFNDPRVVRGPMQFARLNVEHPAMRRALALTTVESGPDWRNHFERSLLARRSLFFRRGGVMLVTELFLPNLEPANDE